VCVSRTGCLRLNDWDCQSQPKTFRATGSNPYQYLFLSQIQSEIRDILVIFRWCPLPTKASVTGKLQAWLHGQPWSGSQLWVTLWWPPSSGSLAETMVNLVTMIGIWR